MEIFVINRDDRPERLMDVRSELEKQGLNAHRFDAIVNKQGFIGCRNSHLAVMEKCRNESTFMILEDDATFLYEKYYTQLFIKAAMIQLCSDWDALFLGCSPQEQQEHYSNNLYRLRNAKCTHAIIWHNRPNGAVEYILAHKTDIGKIDRYLYEVIMPMFQIYCVYPMLVTQKQTKSDIAHRSDCSSIERNFIKYCI
jgi:GR25 family glycosyltransferase involved in LPS biosynthesis